MLTAITKTRSISKNHLLALHRLMLDHNDEENANKLVDLYKKLNDQERVISFAGHFSAGKSSIINTLLGKEILPKSPIPTSANIVKISSGDGVARIFFHHEEPVQYKEPYDFEMIKDYCMNKDTIKRIEISTSDKIIPSGCSIVDTPGIDAADDTDRIITESSLHVVDVLFYVMDYNHVQSEVNLQFLQNIQKMNIPFFVIINQIDKHNEAELPFSMFQETVEHTFLQWELTPEKVFYSSLFNFELEQNQFTDIKETVFSILHQNEVQIRIDAATKQIVEEHIRFLKEKASEQVIKWSNDDGYSSSEITEKISAVEDGLYAMMQKRNNMEEMFKDVLENTLKNAYLMPADLRDVAAQFLEAQQKSFKIGFLGARKKTEREKERRTNMFFNGVRQSIESNIQWKLREKFANIVNQYKLIDGDLQQQIQQFTISFTVDDLYNEINAGATLNGNYVLNYTKAISLNIENKFKREAYQLLNTFHHVMEEGMAEERKNYEHQLKLLKTYEQQEQQNEQIEHLLKQNIQLIRNQLIDPDVTPDDKGLMESKIVGKDSIKLVEMDKENIVEVTEKQDGLQHVTKQQVKTRTNTHSMDHIIPIIEQTIETVIDLQGFQSIINDLQNRKNQLENRSLTIALFGAFSAGKSSFINALIGENILPSSPNPTTAVINRITPVTDQYKHGTVIVHLKEEQQLWDDLWEIIKPFSPPEGANFTELLQWTKHHQIFKKPELNKMYQSYVLALMNGYEKMVDDLGNERIVSFNEFPQYAADETKACYVEAIDLYYDCPITKKGITIVDTPGADSVNARHTNVSFDYIKYADAILYVTYYNHALSRADKDFLMQLGRVKETFELDKMFFIVNASDLAKNQEELTMVIDYVSDQLVQLGIRFPRVFPVSSKHSLSEKMGNIRLNEEMLHFEHTFFDFIDHDLLSLLIETIFFDIRRVKKTLTNFIEAINLDEKDKEAYRDRLRAEQIAIKQSIEKFDLTVYNSRLHERIEKQFYYLKQRIAIRFHDMFKDIFNPTSITESGKKGIGQLKICMGNLLDYFGYELLQEVRAISLRIEKYMNELTEEIYETTMEMVTDINPKITLPSINFLEFLTPNFGKAFQSLDVDHFEKTLSRYKGTKAFFVNNERERMKDELYQLLIPEIDAYCKNASETMTDSYVDQWDRHLEVIKTELIDDVVTYVNHQLSMMSEQIDQQLLINKQQKLATLLSENIMGD